MKYLLIPLLLLLLSGVAVASPLKAPPSMVGTAGPNFSLPDIHGQVFHLRSCRGQVVVLNFWAFWCDTWKAEMPYLRKLAAKQNEMGFKLVAISVDGSRLPVFQKDMGGQAARFPVLLDINRKVSQSYHIVDVPTVVILGRGGHIRYAATGYPGNEVVLDQLRRIESLR